MLTDNYFHIEFSNGRVSADSKAIEAWLPQLIDAAPWPLVGSVFGLHSPDVRAALAMLQRSGWSGQSASRGETIPGYAAAVLLHHVSVSTDLRAKFSHVAQLARGPRNGHSGGANVLFGDGSVKFRAIKSPGPNASPSPSILIGLLLPSVQKVHTASANKPVASYKIHQAWPT